MKIKLPIKTVFLGSNWESLETLKTLHLDSRFKITGVITQPDKPVGRKKKMHSTPVKTYSLKNKIPVYHTLNNKDRYKEAMEIFKPELVVCKAFGELIPGFFLEEPRYKAINVHFSLLPKYRGAVPVQMAILNGDDISGITIVKMVKDLDAGPVLKKYQEKIKADDTNLTLRKRLVKKAAEVLPDDLIDWCNGEIELKPQDDKKATYCYQEDIAKENAFIEFEIHTAKEIDQMVRAFIPWPVAWTFLDDNRLKIFETSVISKSQIKNPNKYTVGEFFSENEKLYVKCKNKTFLKINSLQPAGKRKMQAKQFVHGWNNK